MSNRICIKRFNYIPKMSFKNWKTKPKVTDSNFKSFPFIYSLFTKDKSSIAKLYLYPSRSFEWLVFSFGYINENAKKLCLQINGTFYKIITELWKLLNFYKFS